MTTRGHGWGRYGLGFQPSPTPIPPHRFPTFRQLSLSVSPKFGRGRGQQRLSPAAGEGEGRFLRPLYPYLVSCILLGLGITVRVLQADTPSDSTDVSALIRALDGGDETARASAIRSLSGQGQAVVPGLERVVAEGSWWAREGALGAMAGMGKAGLPPLVEAARTDARVEVRRFAARMIGRIRDDAARDALLGMMSDPEVRSVSASALGELGDSAAVPSLVRFVDDPSRSVRRACAASLGKLRAAPAVPVLIRAIRDPHQSVRLASAGALAAIGPPAVEGLSRVLGDPDPLVRALAAETLGRVGGPEAAFLLSGYLKDPDWGVRASAARGLGLCGAVTDLPELKDRLAGEQDRFVAREVLGAIRRVEERH